KRKVIFAGEACFVRAIFNGRASFKLAEFNKEATFDGAEIKGPAQFQGALFKGVLNLREAYFRIAMFRDELDENAPDGKDQFLSAVNLRGFTYESVSVAWRELLQRA